MDEGSFNWELYQWYGQPIPAWLAILRAKDR